MSLPPSAGSAFRPVSPATRRRSGRPDSVTKPRTPRRAASPGTATFHRFIKHVPHVKSTSGDLQVKPPIHPISDDTLTHLLTHIAILMVCGGRVFHTNGGNSPGGTGTRRRPPLRSRPKARSDTPEGCGAGVPQSSGTARRAGESIPANRPSFGPMGIPRPGQPSWTCAGTQTGAPDVCLSLPSGFVYHLVIAAIRQ